MKELLKSKKIMAIYLSSFLVAVGAGVSMISGPWAIVNRKGGDFILGFMVMIPTVVIFLFAPYWGTVIDRFVRVSILKSADGTALLLLLSIMVLNDLFQWMAVWLFISYLINSLFYMLRLPVVTSALKELVPPAMHSVATSLLEITYQVAYILAGAICLFFINQINIWFIFTITLITYLVSFGLLIFLERRQWYSPGLISLSHKQTNFFLTC